jgi:hypothetical protein
MNREDRSKLARERLMETMGPLLAELVPILAVDPDDEEAVRAIVDFGMRLYWSGVGVGQTDVAALVAEQLPDPTVNFAGPPAIPTGPLGDGTLGS